MITGLAKTKDSVEIIFYCEKLKEYKYYICSHEEYQKTSDEELEIRATN